VAGLDSAAATVAGVRRAAGSDDHWANRLLTLRLCRSTARRMARKGLTAFAGAAMCLLTQAHRHAAYTFCTAVERSQDITQLGCLSPDAGRAPRSEQHQCTEAVVLGGEVLRRQAQCVQRPVVRTWHRIAQCTSAMPSADNMQLTRPILLGVRHDCVPDASNKRTASGSSLWALQCKAVRPRESMSLALAPLQDGRCLVRRE